MTLESLFIARLALAAIFLISVVGKIADPQSFIASLAAGSMPAGITASVVGNTVTLTGAATLANYQAAIRAITYATTSDTPDTTARTITVVVTDGTSSSNVATSTINVVPNNDAPRVTATTASVSEEGLSGGIVDTSGSPTDTTNSTTASGTVTITDPEGQAISGITLTAPTAALTSGGFAVTWSGSGSQSLTATANGQTVATVTINNAGQYTFTLLKPIDLAKGNRVLLYEVVNRGNKQLAGFNVGGDPGDGFFYRRGYTILWSGWQGDVVPTATNETIQCSVQ